MSGTQSPSSNKPDPMLPKDAPQMTQADQRPGKSFPRSDKAVDYGSAVAK